MWYYRRELEDLNLPLNWTDNEEPSCRHCHQTDWGHQSIAAVQVGCYAATLAHYERCLGPLPETPSRDRRQECEWNLMVLFQDPRSTRRFKVANPREDPALLQDNLHHYFCLDRAAWADLWEQENQLPENPSWPTEQNAHLFLRRYFQNGGWSYDGFIAYLLWLFQPTRAYVTNLAKCYFNAQGNVANGPKSANGAERYSTCASSHLKREIELFQPNLVISFTSKVRSVQDLQNLCRVNFLRCSVLYQWHPAYRFRPQNDKAYRFVQQICSLRDSLTGAPFCLNLGWIQSRWAQDAHLFPAP